MKGLFQRLGLSLGTASIPARNNRYEGTTAAMATSLIALAVKRPEVMMN